MNVNWGKPTIVVQDLEATNAGWKKLPTPVQDSTEMQTEWARPLRPLLRVASWRMCM